MSSQWPEVVVKEVCESVVDCVNKTAPVVDYITPYRMIRTTNVKNGTVNLEGARYVTQEVYEKWTRRVVPQYGDVILTREAPLGEVGMLKSNEKIFLGQRLMQYRANPEKLNNHFLLYALQESFMQGQIRASGSGSTVEHMRVGDAENLKIKLPYIQVQHKIASILSAYDDLIENNNRRIAILEEMARSLYREWFVKFRFPGHEEVKMVDSELGQIPEGWEVKKLHEISYLTMGQSPKSEFYNEDQDGLPFFQGVADFGGRFPSNRIYCTKSTRFATKGDILFSVRAPVGRLNFAHEDLAIGRGLAAIKSKDANQNFLFLQLKTIFYKDDIMGNGSIFNSVTKDDVQKIKILVPNADIVKIFENNVGVISKMLDNLHTKNRNLKTQRDMLLPKLISGKLQIT